MQPSIPNKNWPYKESCHLTADTEKELYVFAVGVLGLKRSWFQSHPTHPHYDLTRNKRTLAVKNGAVEIVGLFRTKPRKNDRLKKEGNKKCSMQMNYRKD